MTHQPSSDPAALTARLGAWALAFAAGLMELIEIGLLSRALARWAGRWIAKGERGAMALAVLVALRKAPAPPPLLKRTTRPFGAAPGFDCRAVRDPRVARIARGLFPRTRDVVARVRRLAAVLADLDAASAPVLARLLRPPPLTRLCAVAPPASVLCGLARIDAPCADTS